MSSPTKASTSINAEEKQGEKSKKRKSSSHKTCSFLSTNIDLHYYMDKRSGLSESDITKAAIESFAKEDPSHIWFHVIHQVAGVPPKSYIKRVNSYEDLVDILEPWTRDVERSDQLLYDEDSSTSTQLACFHICIGHGDQPAQFNHPGTSTYKIYNLGDNNSCLVEEMNEVYDRVAGT